MDYIGEKKMLFVGPPNVEKRKTAEYIGNFPEIFPRI